MANRRVYVSIIDSLVAFHLVTTLFLHVFIYFHSLGLWSRRRPGQCFECMSLLPILSAVRQGERDTWQASVVEVAASIRLLVPYHTADFQQLRVTLRLLVSYEPAKAYLELLSVTSEEWDCLGAWAPGLPSGGDGTG